MPTDRHQSAWAALQGLALGDALGSQFYIPANRTALDERSLPPALWQWTDDTEMAASVYAVLAAHGSIEQDVLAASFARHHDFDRGYGPSTTRLLRLIREGGDWRALATGLFDGAGSWGNGAAMRVAPLGAFHLGDPHEAARQAALSATVTHTHPEAVAGAIAVAVAAAVAAATGSSRGGDRHTPGPFIDRILQHVPEGLVRGGIEQARRLLTISDPEHAASVLGNGRTVTAYDTVPFTIWAAAKHLNDFEQAIWTTARAGGDVDTNCAIVGGIVGAHVGADRLPTTWLAACEPLPGWAEAEATTATTTTSTATATTTTTTTTTTTVRAGGGASRTGDLRDRIMGCLLAGAIGDALGAPIEFDSLDVIRRIHGPQGLDEIGWYAGRQGAITDDTQMTLFTVEGLLRAATTGGDVAGQVWAAHRRWLVTQTKDRPPASLPATVRLEPGNEITVDGGLAAEAWLYSRRAPGNACMSGLRSSRMGTIEAPANPTSKGCGTVMRSAPFGLVPAWTPEVAFRLAAECSAQTHGHPTGYLAAGAYAAIVRLLIDGVPLADAVERTLGLLAGHEGHEETSAALRQAVAAASAGRPSPEQVERLGGAWIAEEALAIAVYCALSHPGDLRAALLLAVNHSGDSDSTGSLCGNLLGAVLGTAALPADWADLLEGRPTIERMAGELAASQAG